MADHEVIVNGSDYTNYLVSYEIIERLNELYEFTVNLADIPQSDTNVRTNNIVKIRIDGSVIFKGRIERPEYTSSTNVKISGYNMGVKLLNRKMDRYQATNRNPTGSSPSIFTDIISENQNGTGSNIMNIGTNTAYGDVISFRVEYDNRLRAVAGLANALGWDWWVDWDGSDNDQINIGAIKGSASSVQTFSVFSTLGSSSVTEAHGVSLSMYYGLSSNKRGAKITVGNADVTLQTITKSASCNSSTAYLTNSSLVTLASAAFSGTNATFSYTLSANTSYYLLVDSGGADFTSVYYNPVSYPISGTTLNWVAGYNGGDNNSIYAITQVTVLSTVSLTPNCKISSRETDQQSLVNWITVLGYGDGINQLSTDFFAASPVYTTISSNVTASAATINVVSAASFAATGYIKIGTELVYYGGKGATSFTGCVRGVRDFGTGTVAGSVLTDATKGWSTNAWKGMYLTIGGTDYKIISNTSTAITVSGSPPAGSQSYRIRNEVYSHYKGCVVFEYNDGSSTYIPQSPKTNSSINLYGIHEYRLSKKDVIDLPTLELLGTRYLLDRFVPLERILIEPDRPQDFFTTITIGDTITLNDENTGLSSTQYRVVGRRIIFSMEDMTEVLEYEVRDRKVNFVAELGDTKEDTDTLNAYMQGATNIYQVSSYENADTVHPLNLRFYVPSDAIAVNKVTVSFKMKNYRAYTTTSATGNSTWTSVYDQTGQADLINVSTWYTQVTATSDTLSGAINECVFYLTFTVQPSAGSVWQVDVDVGGVVVFTETYDDTTDISGSHYTILYQSANVNPSNTTCRVRMQKLTSTTITVASCRLVVYGTTGHTHTMGYAIAENTGEFTPPGEVTLAVGTEGSETTVGVYSSDQNGIDITPYIGTAGAWYNAKFTPTASTYGGRMRIEANIYVQVFLQSR